MKKSSTKKPTIEELLQQLNTMTETIKTLQDAQKTTIQPQPQKERNNISVPQKTKKDIPLLLDGMTKENSIAYFGFMKNNKKENPYGMVGISKFFRDNNIVVDATKHERIGFTYEQKHNIILKQLTGETKTVFNTVKKNCIDSLQEKLKGIPTGTQRNGKPLTDKQKQSMTTAISTEISRWNNDKQ